MDKIEKLAQAAKVAALCLPPITMALIGLAALSRKKGREVVLARSQRKTDSPLRTTRRVC